MNKYIFYIILISNFSFSQERRITRQANSYIVENKDSISMDKAINKYNNAIKLNDNFNIAKYNLSNSLYKNKEYEEAIKLLDEVIISEKDANRKASAYYNKGINELEIYHLNKNEKNNYLEKAANSFKESLKLNPNDEDSRLNLAKCLSLLNNQDEKEDKNDQDEKEDKNDQDEKEDKNDQDEKEDKNDQDEKEDKNDQDENENKNDQDEKRGKE